tara:strand:- start:1021 stop:1662 length:642 start_codon:yes stop_codon:yes gene_type:complete
MSIDFKIQLERGFAQKFEKQVRLEVRNKILKSLPRAIANIEKSIRILVINSLEAAPEYQSIAGGILRHQFGLVDGAARIANIVQQFADEIQVTFVPGLGDFGGIKIGILETSYSRVLSLPASEFVTEKGKPLEWLRWLLQEGGNRIVIGYSFKDGSAARSRTGSGIMIERQGSAWSVPVQFQGTDNNNFATRALEDLEDNIEVVVRRELSRVI